MKRAFSEHRQASEKSDTILIEIQETRMDRFYEARARFRATRSRKERQGIVLAFDRNERALFCEYAGLKWSKYKGQP